MPSLLRYSLIAVLVLLVILAIALYLGLGPSPACWFPHSGRLETGISARVVNSSGVDRCYLVYTPAAHDPEEATPVVFSLHGFAGNPQGLRSIANWEPVADEKGFLVIYPHGSLFPLRWNTEPAANIAHIDDVQFIRDMLADLSEITALDETRVYVTGLSNGATMVDQIACALADRVAAIGVVAGKGEDPPETCKPSRPVPVIAFFGTEDPLEEIVEYPRWFLRLINVAPSVNDRELLPLQTWIDGWVQRNGCDPNPETPPCTGDACSLRYSSCTYDAEVWIFRIQGGGHTWPGGSSLAAFGKTSADISASATMWDFFKSHALTSEP